MKSSLDDLIQVLLRDIRKEIPDRISRISVDRYLGDLRHGLRRIFSPAHGIDRQCFTGAGEVKTKLRAYCCHYGAGKVIAYAMNMLGQVVGLMMWRGLRNISRVKIMPGENLTETACIWRPSLRHRSLHAVVSCGFPAGMNV